MSIKLLPAVTSFYNRLEAFLEKDKEVTTAFDYDTKIITVTVHNPIKAAAWQEILPHTMEVDEGITCTINVECDVHGVDKNVLETALWDNPLFSRYWESVAGYHFCYLTPNVVQFQNDNFCSPESLETDTPEELAKMIFRIPTLQFCTEPLEGK